MQKLDISAITGRKSGAGYARRLQAIALANQALPDLMYLVTGSQLYTLHVRLRSARHAPNRVRRSEILFCGTKSTGARPLRQQAGYPMKVG